MPIYEYRCPNGHTFEVFQRMSDPPASECEECGEGPVEKVLYPVAVHFKGSGFYSTDYGRGGVKRAAKDGDGGSGSGSTGESTKATDSGGGSGSASGSGSESAGSGSGDKKTSSD